MIVWWATEVEAISALARRHRDGQLGEAALAQARSLLSELTESWSEVQPSARLRNLAERLLLVHPLRAGDALQLAGALSWADGDSRKHYLMCVDERLRLAALREGFLVLPE
jgi:hypothetical protein